MLSTDHLDEGRAKRAIEIIERNARAQAQLIEDLLDVSRIITGKLQLDVRPLMVRRVVNDAVESVTHTAQEKGIDVAIDLIEDDGPMVGDAGRLQQVIWNLLTNAIKFTPPGGRVEVHLRRHDQALELRVRDTGEGMENSDIPLVFDRFRQAAHRRRTGQGGLGLGLGIARHIVEAHGGTIRAHSEGKGKGSTFTVDLPLAADKAPANAVEQLEVECPPSLEGRRVLVVEDKRDSRELVEIVFEECRMEVVSVNSARAALLAMDRERFDVIVSDVGLPDGDDGLALMRRVRERPADLGGLTPAIALTAYASAIDRRHALAAGYQTYLTKPYEPADLVAAVASLLSVQKPMGSDSE